MRIIIEFDDNDNNILREAFEEKIAKTLDSSFTKKSDCSFNLNLIGCLIYEAERRINGSVRYSIVPEMIDFKDTKKLERRNKI